MAIETLTIEAKTIEIADIETWVEIESGTDTAAKAGTKAGVDPGVDPGVRTTAAVAAEPTGIVVPVARNRSGAGGRP